MATKHARASAAPEPAKSDKVQAFCLRDCAYGKAGEVVEVTAAEAGDGTKHGALDTNPAAIAHAKQNR